MRRGKVRRGGPEKMIGNNRGESYFEGGKDEREHCSVMVRHAQIYPEGHPVLNLMTHPP